MQLFKNKYVYYSVIGVVTLVAFVVLSQFSQTHVELLKSLTQQAGILGVLSYISLMIIAIVIAPVSMVFLLPVAANSYGPLLAGVYTITGWMIGSMIAFYLARRYGLRWVSNVEKINSMREVEQALPRRNVFIIIVFLRMTLPVDLLSYALGVFSTIGYSGFFFSTIIGITPFAFLMMYASVGSVWLQIATIILGSILFAGGLYYLYSRSAKYKNS